MRHNGLLPSAVALPKDHFLRLQPLHAKETDGRLIQNIATFIGQARLEGTRVCQEHWAARRLPFNKASRSSQIILESLS